MKLIVMLIAIQVSFCIFENKAFADEISNLENSIAVELFKQKKMLDNLDRAQIEVGDSDPNLAIDVAVKRFDSILPPMSEVASKSSLDSTATVLQQLDDLLKVSTEWIYRFPGVAERGDLFHSFNKEIELYSATCKAEKKWNSLISDNNYKLRN